MNSSMMSMGLIAATALAGAAGTAQAAAAAHPGPRAPAIVTAQLRGTVSDYVDAYAIQGTAGNGHASEVVIFPTADRNVVFVTFQIGASPAATQRIALVEMRHGRVRRFTDFAAVADAPAQRTVSVTATATGDAQAQARALLNANVTTSDLASDVHGAGERDSAQAQAGTLLRAVSAGLSVAPRRLARAGDHAANGQEMARRLLTSSGE